MADQLSLALEEAPFYLRVYALTPCGEIEVDRIQVNDPRVDPLDRWKVAAGLARLSISEAECLLQRGWLTWQTWPC
jgi:hypothetical protein